MFTDCRRGEASPGPDCGRRRRKNSQTTLPVAICRSPQNLESRIRGNLFCCREKKTVKSNLGQFDPTQSRRPVQQHSKPGLTSAVRSLQALTRFNGQISNAIFEASELRFVLYFFLQTCVGEICKEQSRADYRLTN